MARIPPTSVRMIELEDVADSGDGRRNFYVNVTGVRGGQWASILS